MGHPFRVPKLIISLVSVCLLVGTGQPVPQQRDLGASCKCERPNELVELIDTAPTNADIPWSWRNRPQPFEFRPVDDAVEKDLYTAIILSELQKYDPDLLRKWVTKIYVVRTLQFSGINASGSQGMTKIWVATHYQQGQPFSEWQVRATLHHEIGSILFQSTEEKFPRAQWWADGPAPTYTFVNDTTEAVRQGKSSTSLDLELAKSGFLTEYSKTALFKDFATIHQWMMTYPETACCLGNRYPPLGTKIKVWSQFTETWRTKSKP